MALIFVVLAPFFQLIFGKMILNKSKLLFGIFSLICLAAQIALTFLGIDYILEQLNDGKETFCAMPALGLFIIGVFMFILLIICIIIQYYINAKKKTATNSSLQRWL